MDPSENTIQSRQAPTSPGEAAFVPLRGKVLIIDDEPFVAGLCQKILMREHDVQVSTSAGAALSRFEAGEDFDVVLCDLMMPDMSGMELYDVLGERFAALQRRVVFLSGGAFTPAAQAFRASTPNLFVDKPCPPEVLRDVVRRRVHHVRSEQP